MKFKLISISIFLLSGCQLTQEAEKISEYHPIQNSVHSFYNEQVMTLNTPNERLQVKSRNKSSSDVIMCVNKKNSGILLFDNMAVIESVDGKAWPKFGFIVNKIEQEMYDGSIDNAFYFRVENAKYNQRNNTTTSYSTTTYELKFNNEKKDGFYTGSFLKRADTLFINNEINSVMPADNIFYSVVKCKYLSHESSIKYKRKIAGLIKTNTQKIIL